MYNAKLMSITDGAIVLRKHCMQSVSNVGELVGVQNSDLFILNDNLVRALGSSFVM